tara:strand:+ start:1529 stop:1663 length:135 start_codon:yes stop_codon:yes gene_type:complete
MLLSQSPSFESEHDKIPKNSTIKEWGGALRRELFILKFLFKIDD